MRSLEIAVKAYVDDNNGRRPMTLDNALVNIGFSDVEKSSRMLRCPGATRDGAGSRTNVASRMGYCYVDWSKWFGQTNTPPDSYPLIYDRSLQNHGGKGVNVISVGGQIRWDEGAAWLRSFAAEHREYQLPLPN